jgi:hypothetical protein
MVQRSRVPEVRHLARVLHQLLVFRWPVPVFRELVRVLRELVHVLSERVRVFRKLVHVGAKPFRVPETVRVFRLAEQGSW